MFKKLSRLFIAAFCFIIHDCYAVIVVDIAQCSQAFNLDTDDQQKICVRQSVRVVTFDTEKQKLLRIDYLLAPTHKVKQSVTLNSCSIAYELLTNDQINFSISLTPPTTDYCFRSPGKFIGDKGTRVELKADTTLTGWQFVSFKKHAPIKSFEDLSTQLNTHTVISAAHKKRLKKIADLKELLESTKTAKARKALEEKLKAEQAVSPKRPSLTGGELKPTLHFKGSKYNFTFFDKAYEPERGFLGELACDITLMMTQTFTKIDGKYGSNNGFDGLYEWGEFMIASESKLHQSPPTLDEIIAKELKPKFSIEDKRAITLIKESTRQKILKASADGKLYLLAYVVLKNGKVDCRLNTEPYTVLLPKIKEEPTEQATPEAPKSKVAALTPLSSEKEQQAHCQDFLNTFMQQTGKPIEEALKLIIASSKTMPKKPSAVKALFQEAS